MEADPPLPACTCGVLLSFPCVQGPLACRSIVRGLHLPRQRSFHQDQSVEKMLPWVRVEDESFRVRVYAYLLTNIRRVQVSGVHPFFQSMENGPQLYLPYWVLAKDKKVNASSVVKAVSRDSNLVFQHGCMIWLPACVFPTSSRWAIATLQ